LNIIVAVHRAVTVFVPPGDYLQCIVSNALAANGAATAWALQASATEPVAAPIV
jgi:hypothetical protein